MPRTDRASRVIRTTPEKVYAALVDPGALSVWLPPAGMIGKVERFDLRPGGSYRMVLTYVEPSASRSKSTGDSDIAEGRFVEIVPGRRVSYSVDFVSDDPAYAGTMTITWEVIPVHGGTRVDITANDVPDGISPADHAAGMNSSLTHLIDYLE